MVALAVLAIGLASMVFSFDTAPPPARPVAAAPRAPVIVAEPRAMPERAVSPAAPLQATRTATRSADLPRAIRRGALTAPPGQGKLNEPSQLSLDSDAAPIARRHEAESRFDSAAENLGWDEARTNQVRGIVMQTLEGVEGRLAGIRERDQWVDARQDVASFRREQAQHLVDILGEDDFRALVKEAQFTRIPSTTGQPGIRWFPARVQTVEEIELDP